MKKEYKYVPASSGESDTPDENGITDSMLHFSWDRDVEMSVSWTGIDSVITEVFLMVLFIYSSPPKLIGRIQRKR